MSRLVVLYDLDCGLCIATADRLRRWDRGGRLELLPLQGAAGSDRPVLERVAADHALHAELHVVNEATGVVRSGGRAFLTILAALPGGRVPAALVGLPPFAWAVGLGYALVARNRRAIGRALRLEQICEVPAQPANGSR